MTDKTSLFMFQLACLVNMVPKWKKHTMRVFIVHVCEGCRQQHSQQGEGAVAITQLTIPGGMFLIPSLGNGHSIPAGME